MSNDSEPPKPLYGTFSVQAGHPPKQNQQPARSEEINSVSDTAQNQIDARARYDERLESHEAAWKQQRDALAHKQHPAPSLGLESPDHRAIQKEYQDRRSHWDAQAEAIDQAYAQERSDIRESGQTPSDHFKAVACPKNDLCDQFEVGAQSPQTGRSR